MAFNITTKQLADSSTLTLVDPASGVTMYADEAESQPLQIIICGKASKQYRQALSTLSRKSLARKGKPQSFEQNVIDNNEFLSAISLKAINFDMGDGVPIDSQEQFMKLYSNNGLYWIKEQVSSFLEDNDSFLEA